MIELEQGTEVLIRVKIIRRLVDNRLPDQCGYIVATSRGQVFVEPEDIVFRPFLSVTSPLTAF